MTRGVNQIHVFRTPSKLKASVFPIAYGDLRSGSWSYALVFGKRTVMYSLYARPRTPNTLGFDSNSRHSGSSPTIVAFASVVADIFEWFHIPLLAVLHYMTISICCGSLLHHCFVRRLGHCQKPRTTLPSSVPASLPTLLLKLAQMLSLQITPRQKTAFELNPSFRLHGVLLPTIVLICFYSGASGTAACTLQESDITQVRLLHYHL